MGQIAAPPQSDADTFIRRWTAREGGAERANYALFLVELCDLIGVQRPDPAGPETERNEYVFERSVRFRHEDGTTSPGRIDLRERRYLRHHCSPVLLFSSRHHSHAPTSSSKHRYDLISLQKH